MDFRNERQTGFRKSEIRQDHHALELPTQKPLGHPLTFLMSEQKTTRSPDNLSVGAERRTSHPLIPLEGLGYNPSIKSSSEGLSASYSSEVDIVNKSGLQYESSMFSSSMSELLNMNLRLSANNARYSHSVDTSVSLTEDKGPLESIEEIEAQTIGNLLPSDEDLFTGLMDRKCHTDPSIGADDVEFDLFSNVGGMELEGNGSGSLNVPRFLGTSNHHLYGKNLSRTLYVRNIDSHVEDSELITLFEQYGDIHTLDTACKHCSFVMVSYFDIRAAINAMQSLQDRRFRHTKLDIHYSVPKGSQPDDFSQGIVTILGLDASVTNDNLSQIFGVYGDIKEIHKAPHGSVIKCIEYYDNRSAAAAFHSLNGKEIAGKKIQIEPGHPRALRQDEHGLNFRLNGSPIPPIRFPVLETTYHHGVSSTVPTGSSPLLKDSTAISSRLATPGPFSTLKFDLQGSTVGHPHSLPEYHNRIRGGTDHPGDFERIRREQLCRVCLSSGKESCSLHHYAWSNHVNSEHPNFLWPNTSSFGGGISLAGDKASVHGPPRAPSQMLNSVTPVTNHHVGSAPTTNSFWDRQHSYQMEFVSKTIFPDVAGNCMDLPIDHESMALPSYQMSSMYPARTQLTTGNERARSRRTEGYTNHADKRRYELDVDRILRGEDNRTTIMIKNIPNKYTSKMLLATIDARHKGTYDFIYLPIDFKNKCNVGYAFINMIDPRHIIPFYQFFEGKRWEKFNSEKVAALAYARIQGKSALIAHFQNSSLMNEDKRCRPILFSTDGPNAGDQVPFPTGSSGRGRAGKPRTAAYDENCKGTAYGLANEEDSLNQDAPTRSGKESN